MASEVMEQLNLDKQDFSYFQSKAEEIQRDCSDFITVRAKSPEVRYQSSGFLTYLDDNGELHNSLMSTYSRSQLCNKLGVSSAYINKCIDNGMLDLVSLNINSWMDEYNAPFFIREYKGTVRGVLTPKYSVCDTKDILDVVSDSIPVDNYRVKGYFLNEEFTNIRMVSKERLHVENEDLYPGFSLVTSDVGRSILSLKFFVWKKVCTNGLIVPKQIGDLYTQKHVGLDKKEFHEELVASFKTYKRVMTEVEARIMGAKSATLKDAFKDEDSLTSLINSVRAKVLVSEESAKKIVYLMQNGTYEKNRFGLINSITQIAQDFSLDKRLDMERIAGNMLVA